MARERERWRAAPHWSWQTQRPEPQRKKEPLTLVLSPFLWVAVCFVITHRLYVGGSTTQRISPVMELWRSLAFCFPHGEPLHFLLGLWWPQCTWTHNPTHTFATGTVAVWRRLEWPDASTDTLGVAHGARNFEWTAGSWLCCLRPEPRMSLPPQPSRTCPPLHYDHHDSLVLF